MNRPAILALAAGGVLALAVGSAFARSVPGDPAAAPAAPLDPWADPWADAWSGLTSSSTLAAPVIGPAGDAEGSISTEAEEGEGAAGLVDDYLLPAAFAVLAPWKKSRQRMSPGGLALLQRHEGYSSTVYLDPVGIPTIGYGHRVLPGESFGTLTIDEALEILARDVGKAENAVNASVRVELSQPQFDALVSFAYNVGVGAFASSTLVRLLNQGNYAAVPAQLARWKYGSRNGVKVELPGLVTRRADEGQVFASGTGAMA